MKKPFFVLLGLLLPVIFYGQHSLSGVWSGTLNNDSATARKDQSFEIALTEYKGKVYGYSRSTFIVNDTLYYILKRVKGKIEDGICEVKDDEIISYNFRGRLDKGVKVTTVFRMNEKDSTWYMSGDWQTNKTKKFYAISGKVELKEETNFEHSRIVPHLEELKLADELPFYAAAKQKTKPVVQNDKPVKDIATTDKTKPAQLAATEKEKPVKKEEPKQPQPVTKAPSTNEENKATAPSVPVTAGAPLNKQTVAAALVAERKTAPPQIVQFKSDSLQLALYDNGEIDGDTVSVLLNGELIMSRQGLRSTAIRKTIYIPSSATEITLVLYAENLGRYPPNTGLLVVHDGDESYQVRFSADLQQNAAVLFRRKKQ